MQFLCNGLEDDLNMRLGTLLKRQPTELEAFESASGKITLLAKLLPKLKSEGHKVLIFSQFKIMLDLIQYYLNMLHMPMERIDGDTKGAPSYHV
jgi:SNF2 family DNA or RNA helicase